MPQAGCQATMISQLDHCNSLLQGSLYPLLHLLVRNLQNSQNVLLKM